MRVADILNGSVSLTQRETERGWLTSLPRDAGQDPPDMDGCRLPPMPKPAEPKRGQR